MSMESPTGKSKKSKASHLEFDFDGPSSHQEPPLKKGKAPKVVEPKMEAAPEMPFGKPISPDFEKEPEKVSIPEPSSPLLKGTAIGSFKTKSSLSPKSPKTSPAIGKSTGKEKSKEPLITPLPPMETTMSSQIPSMSDFRRNAERQSREQQATGNILSGIAYALLAVIIIVASLSAFGGYVMWRQIQNQATTVAQLNDRLNNEVALLREEAAQTKKSSDDVFRRQQETLNKLTVTLEQQRATFLNEQKKKEQQIQLLQGRVGKIESRFTTNR